MPRTQYSDATQFRGVTQNLPNFGSLFGFKHRIKTLEANFSKFMQTNQLAEAISSILGIVDRYIDYRMNEVVKVTVQLQSDRLRDEAQAENEDFTNKLDEKNSKHNKGASQEASQDTYGDTITLKRRLNDADKDEEPSVGSDQGSKRRREGKEPEESSRDVYSKRRIIAVTELQIVEWHNYKHLDWITLTNLTVKERFAFNVSLRMFTRSIVIQQRVKDLQLCVESYQKKLNLTKPDTYMTDLKRKDAYTAYSNPRGFIYQNKDKHNRTMDMTIDQKVALDEALAHHTSRLRIVKSNFRLRSDITSKESTLQVVYDVLRLTLFYKAFLVTADVPEIYMQEFWATATVHHHLIHFKMNNKIQEILAFLTYLGHSGEIKKIIDVNINKLHQPWRSFAAVINKCLSGKSIGYESIRDDQMFITIKLVSRHQNTQQFGDILPIELTNKDIRNSAAYKEYYAIASRAAPPKTKASVRKTQSSSDTTMPPPIAASIRLSTLAKGKQPAKSSKAKDDDDQDDNDDDQDSDNDGDDFVHPKLSTHDKEAKDEESFDPIVQTPSHVDDSDDKSHGMNVRGDEGPDAKDDDDELYRYININLEGRDVQMTDVHTTQVLKDTHVTLTPVNPDGQQKSLSVSSQFVTSMLNPSLDTGMDSLFESTHRVDVPVMTIVVPLLVTAPTLPQPSIPIILQVQQAPAPSPVTTLGTFLQDLPNFGSLLGFDHRLKTLEANFSEFMQTNQFAEAVFFILGILDRYIDHRMNEAVKVAVQLLSDRLRDEAQAENEDFINKLDENIQKIHKEQVKVQVSKILPNIEKTINEQLEAEVLNRTSNSSKTSYVMVVDLSELELKKILIEKMESKKSIHRFYEQRNLYKALFYAYECDKIIPDTYRDTVTLERRRDDEDKDEKPSIGSDRGSKRRRAGKEPESTSAPKEKASKTSSKSTEGSKSYQKTASEFAPVEEPMQTTQYLEEPSHQEFETGAGDDQHVAEASQHTKWFQKQTKPPTPLTNLTVEERFAFNVSLRMFTRSIVIQQRVEDLQLGVESYQKKLNLTKPDTYRSDLKCKEAYTAYSNPRGFIYHNKDKQNRLMHIDELHKFSDGTYNDVRTALDDHLKGI
nr:hypothetical protein [Tanacetum cinerariifolium]